MPFRWNRGVYETAPEGGGFAVDPSLLRGTSRRPDFVAWFDLTHQRMFDVAEVLMDESDEFRFKDSQGRVHFLRTLKLEGYKKRIRPKMGGADFKTLSALKQMVYDVLGLA